MFLAICGVWEFIFVYFWIFYVWSEGVSRIIISRQNFMFSSQYWLFSSIVFACWRLVIWIRSEFSNEPQKADFRRKTLEQRVKTCIFSNRTLLPVFYSFHLT